MVRLKRVEIIGAGPSGLYSAILIKSRMPATRVRVSERNPANATFGFGVVFSDQALDFLQADDPATHALITPWMERWQNMTLSLTGERVTLDGIGFASIERLRLLQILQRRAAELGVITRFDHALDSLAEVEGPADLVIGADGLNSLLRQTHGAEFSPRLDHFNNYFAWFGTPRAFDTLTQTFIRSRHGALNAHHYRYTPSMSTFIVECDPKTFRARGFAEMDEQAAADSCAELFVDTLEGAPLITNHSSWRRFPRLWCDNWVVDNRVILGDAAHTAHFSIGSGTRLALEDSIALADALCLSSDLSEALAGFQQQRQPIAHKIVDAANTSARWYDHFSEHMNLPILDFAYSYLTRSGRIDDQRLRQMAPQFMNLYDDQSAC